MCAVSPFPHSPSSIWKLRSVTEVGNAIIFLQSGLHEDGQVILHSHRGMKCRLTWAVQSKLIPRQIVLSAMFFLLWDTPDNQIHTESCVMNLEASLRGYISWNHDQYTILDLSLLAERDQCLSILKRLLDLRQNSTMSLRFFLVSFLSSTIQNMPSL